MITEEGGAAVSPIGKPVGRTAKRCMKMQGSFVLNVIVAAFFVVGLVFLSVAVRLFVRQKQKKERCNMETMGTVIQIRSITSFTNGDDVVTDMWHPVFAYDAQGERIQKVSPYGSTRKKYQIGQKVQIRYNPDRPEEFFIIGQSTADLLITIFSIIGLALLILSSICFFQFPGFGVAY